MVSTEAGVSTGAVVVPAWRRLRLWVGLGALILFAAVLVSSLTGVSTRPLDPSSPSRSGSKALAELLRTYGTPVTRTTHVVTAVVAGPGTTVLVPRPDAFSRDQLAVLGGSSARLVLVAPSERDLSAVGSQLTETAPLYGPTDPTCRWPGALAAGTVDFPRPTFSYGASGTATRTHCYGGAVVIDEHVNVLGSADLLRNDRLVDTGVAALDINLISDNGNTDEVVWLMPGTDATSAAAPSYWDLFPEGARRAFVWLLLLGVVLVVWRARRFGPVVSEPLPVVVRSAEVVEGHGRLYRRAGARERSAAALRAGAVYRLAAHTGLQRSATPPDVAAAVATLTGRAPQDVLHSLAGPPPRDDASLVRLALDLDALEAAAGVPPRPKGTRS